MSLSQLETARDLIELARDDGYAIDTEVGEFELLDYMGILGVSFVRGDAASREYIEGLSKEDAA